MFRNNEIEMKVRKIQQKTCDVTNESFDKRLVSRFEPQEDSF